MDSKEIIARIKAQGHSQKSFAAAIGMPYSALRQMVCHAGNSRIAARRIATQLNVPAHQMFPEYRWRSTDTHNTAPHTLHTEQAATRHA